MELKPGRRRSFREGPRPESRGLGTVAGLSVYTEGTNSWHCARLFPGRLSRLAAAERRKSILDSITLDMLVVSSSEPPSAFPRNPSTPIPGVPFSDLWAL